MCGRYSVVTKIEKIEQRFNVRSAREEYINPNIAIGDIAPVITADKNRELQFFQFGLTPAWAKKQMYVFNARAEGDRNQTNDPDYSGNMGIMIKPMFKGLIRRRRCLVVADGFIEGSAKDKLAKPYLIFPKDKQRPFAIAGLWDSWKNPKTGEIINSFAIITTAANELLHKIGHHRAPLVLAPHQERDWLSSRTADATTIMEPFKSKFYNAYPISPDIRSAKNKDIRLLDPIGERIYKEYTFKIDRTTVLERKKERMADRAEPIDFYGNTKTQNTDTNKIPNDGKDIT